VCAEEPVFRTVTAEAKTRRLLADEVDSESEKIENHFCRFLLTFSHLAKNGWILWPRGVSFRAIRRLRAALLDS